MTPGQKEWFAARPMAGRVDEAPAAVVDDDPVAAWPKCAVCGKGAREGNHATDLGEGHDYEPVTP